MGDCYKGYWGDTRSLDYDSYKQKSKLLLKGRGERGVPQGNL